MDTATLVHISESFSNLSDDALFLVFGVVFGGIVGQRTAFFPFRQEARPLVAGLLQPFIFQDVGMVELLALGKFRVQYLLVLGPAAISGLDADGKPLVVCLFQHSQIIDAKRL